MASSAAAALGYIAVGDDGEQTLSVLAMSLLKVPGTKSESLMFAVGEALCFAFGGEAHFFTLTTIYYTALKYSIVLCATTSLVRILFGGHGVLPRAGHAVIGDLALLPLSAVKSHYECNNHYKWIFSPGFLAVQNGIEEF